MTIGLTKDDLNYPKTAPRILSHANADFAVSSSGCLALSRKGNRIKLLSREATKNSRRFSRQFIFLVLARQASISSAAVFEANELKFTARSVSFTICQKVDRRSNGNHNQHLPPTHWNCLVQNAMKGLQTAVWYA